MNDVFYFGCWERSGHYLHDSKGTQLWESLLPDDFPVRPTILDGGLLPPNLPKKEGRAALIHIGRWTVITFWDSSVDKRPGSCSAFIMRGYRLDFDAAVAAAKEAFPSVWARFQFDVKEWR